MTAAGAEISAEATEAQARIFAFLADPASYGSPAPAAVKRIDTHGAVVFLAGDNAYKIKRAVRFPFMDFSTLEKRRLACQHEIEVNRRNAPEIYLESVPIRQDALDLHLGGAVGDIVEWAVHQHRFDETKTFDHLADQGRLDCALMAPLAEAIARAHDQAEICGDGATQMLRCWLEDTLGGLAGAGDIFVQTDVSLFRDKCLARFAAVEPLLTERARQGQVRLCHGDLHLRNIVLYEGRPLLFDAIEFDNSIATCDILYDFAFVLMDLWQRGLKAHANRLFNLYLWRIADLEVMLAALAALPLFLAQRAAIRARVTAALCSLDADGRDKRIAEARRFFAAAQSFIDGAPARLVAVGGLSGSGKSSVAKTLAPVIGCAPGAVHLRSDIERKRLFNVGAHEKLPQDAYRPEVTERIYARLRDLAKTALAADHSAIIDAVHARPEERDALAALAAEMHVPFAGFWLEAPGETLIARVETRKNDVSDAHAAIVRRQLGWDLGEIRWRKLDAQQPLPDIVRAALEALG